MHGRYGPYVTDGTTNASLPRGTTVDDVTFEYALNLLKERAAAAPAKKKAPRKKAATKKPAAKKPKKTAAKGGKRKKRA